MGTQVLKGGGKEDGEEGGKLNDMRLQAHAIIADLFRVKATSHLRLLLNHAKSSIKEIEEQKGASRG